MYVQIVEFYNLEFLINISGTGYTQITIRVFANSFFDMGCVYIDTCSMILLGELNTYNF
jgi:hypothetical protein